MATVFLGLSGADIEEIITKALRNAVIYNNQFDVRNVFDEFFTFKHLLPQNCHDEKVLLQIKANFLRKCNGKVFSLQTIADILSSSKTTIQKFVKEAENGE